ncbi:MAG: UDP-N-acetylmuramoyl-tripeptide--D-alanyl-D-alanine ligase, partial [Blastocatellia bacterium]|nr:UDP-N-acetylmuramoyl-tripeptide--D-alanyl-D-alanine ligase [Blastocatellia bacterium]
MKLENIISAIGGNAPQMSPAQTAIDATNFVIDSREIRAGDVFFALSQPEYANNGFNGDFDDSTQYAAGAIAAGAVAVVLREDRYAENETALEPFRDRLIFVEDSIAALQKLAHSVYVDWARPVVAITGSAGKTTAKELTAHVLSGSGRKILKNIKNYNNGLGHPLTVLNLAKDPSFDAAVLEMGMSTPLHEIERLCKITPPDVSVVLNVLPVHLEHLGTIERIAQAKAEIVEGMSEVGTAVLNADDLRVAEMAKLSKGEVITYGIENAADVRATDIQVHGFGETTFQLNIREESAFVRFPLNGRHNIMNALAAAAVGIVFGMTVKEIAETLSTVAPPPQRGEIIRFATGFTVINDSYNSNPDALLSMVETLIEGSPETSRKIVVAGEMLELGPEAADIHLATGRKIAKLGADILIGVRGHGEQLVTGAKDAGIRAEFAGDSAAAAELVADLVQPGDVLLVKGSRGVRTER